MEKNGDRKSATFKSETDHCNYIKLGLDNNYWNCLRMSWKLTTKHHENILHCQPLSINIRNQFTWKPVLIGSLRLSVPGHIVRLSYRWTRDFPTILQRFAVIDFLSKCAQEHNFITGPWIDTINFIPISSKRPNDSYEPMKEVLCWAINLQYFIDWFSIKVTSCSNRLQILCFFFQINLCWKNN